MKSETKAATITATTILQAAWLLIMYPHHWTKRAFARDENGKQTYNPFEGVCWCALGAIRAVEAGATRPWPLKVRQAARHHLRMAVEKLYGDPATMELTTSKWNDRPETTHDDVRKVYDLAIRSASEAEGVAA